MEWEGCRWDNGGFKVRLPVVGCLLPGVLQTTPAPRNIWNFKFCSLESALHVLLWDNERLDYKLLDKKLCLIEYFE